jgi:hypothetical protein
VVNLAT